MALVKVYSPEGEMFEMNTLNAHDVITHSGWTTTNPKAAKANAEKAKAEKADAEKADAEKAKAKEDADKDAEAKAKEDADKKVEGPAKEAPKEAVKPKQASKGPAKK